jgi:hypothetical protein
MAPTDSIAEPSLAEIAREWGRIGCVGFGGPPAHIVLLRELCVTRGRWLTEDQFERAIAATNLLPGPASTQLAIYCAWRLRGPRGALIGGPWLHSAWPGLDPRAVCVVPLGVTARMDTGSRDGSRFRRRRCRGARGARGCRSDLETDHRRSAAPHPGLRARWWDLGSDSRTVARARPAGLRCDRVDLAGPGPSRCRPQQPQSSPPRRTFQASAQLNPGRLATSRG